MSDKFSVWFAEERGDAPRKVRGGYDEPAEAADIAETELIHRGIGGESYAEIRFNGDSEPHSIIFLMDDGNPPTFGIWNTASAMWPIFYPESPYGIMLEGNPLPSDDKKKSDEGNMRLDEIEDDEDDEGEDDADTESPDESEDYPDDEEDENTDEEDEAEEDDPLEPDDDENDSEDSDDDEEDEGENEAPEESEDDDSEDELDDADAEEDGDGDDEKETEMPRLNIFGKMRGPKGWRKRAEAEELNERNVFGLKIGILDPEAEKPGQQERNVVAHVEFIESDTTRDHGVLKLRLPNSVTLDDFTQTKNGVITVNVPYQQD